MAKQVMRQRGRGADHQGVNQLLATEHRILLIETLNTNLPQESPDQLIAGLSELLPLCDR
jgi:hypothetical protein